MNWLNAALDRAVVLRSCRVSLVVGSILVLINQGDVLAGGTISGLVIGKIVLTYCVPYGVSTYASVAAVMSQQYDLPEARKEDQR